MIVTLCLALLLAASLSLSSSATVSHGASLEEQLTDGIIAWVRSNGGFWNDSVEIRRVTIPEMSISYLGVFAAKELEANAKVMNIPQSCYIHVWDDALGMDEDEEDENIRNWHANVCMLSQKMQRELELGDKSAYAPYVAYLQQQGPGQVPATWSNAGKDLLRKVLPPNSDVVDWIDMYYRGDNGVSVDCINSKSKEQDNFLAMTVQRCYDTALIPLWDMVNHDNGKINTNHTTIYSDEGITIWTSEPVPAGGELLASYDGCIDCLGIQDYWGTPEILRDFGFVERSAQRWVYLEQEIWFETHEQENGTTTVHWDDDVTYTEFEDEPRRRWGAPKANGTEFLASELNRIRAVNMQDGEYNSIPMSELGTILQYRETAINSLALAIQSARERQQSDDTCNSEQQ